MFGRKKAAPDLEAANEVRALLYGDAPLATFADGDAQFASVRDALTSGDTSRARIELHGIASAPDSASRHRLQAWHELRALGEQPAAPAETHGVVVDTYLGSSLETLAAYRDGSCRYINKTGKILIWDAADPDIDARTQRVISIGATIAAAIGPWEGPRPALTSGHTRLSMLCLGGLYFGEGPDSALGKDPMAGPLLVSASQLLMALVKKAIP
jgi:hypothetical protein